MPETNLDVIGDIHGHAAVLRRLHFIDRGRQQRDVLHIAMRMGAAETSEARSWGSALAVMGNHEFDALCWAERQQSRPILRVSATGGNITLLPPCFPAMMVEAELFLPGGI